MRLTVPIAAVPCRSTLPASATDATHMRTPCVGEVCFGMLRLIAALAVLVVVAGFSAGASFASPSGGGDTEESDDEDNDH